MTKNKFVADIEAAVDTVQKQDKNGTNVIIPTDKDIDNLIEFIKADPTMFGAYHQPLVDFFAQHYPDETKMPWGIGSRSFYGINLLSHFAPIGFSRSYLQRIFSAVWDIEGDVIQYVNKSGQNGLQHQTVSISRVPFYHLGLLETGNHKRIAYNVDDDHNQKIDKVIQYRERRLANARKAKAEGTIDVGHRNPFGSDPSSQNLIAQVRSENRANRDRYIFDENGDIAAPAPHTLVSKSDEYYDDKALNEIFRGLLKKKGDFLDAETKNALSKFML